MPHRKVGSFLYDILVLTLLQLCLASCTARTLPSGPPDAIFPPQAVMKNGDYARFVTENRQTLEQCEGEAACATALFNMGFVHAYAHSPYYDPARALQYLDVLHQQYPQTPLAFQGQTWKIFLLEKLALEEAQRRLQADLQTLQVDLRLREATIRNLQGRLKRARDIDLQIEKKERELLR
jgi:hypothetical protein